MSDIIDFIQVFIGFIYTFYAFVILELMCIYLWTIRVQLVLGSISIIIIRINQPIVNILYFTKTVVNHGWRALKNLHILFILVLSITLSFLFDLLDYHIRMIRALRLNFQILLLPLIDQLLLVKNLLMTCDGQLLQLLLLFPVRQLAAFIAASLQLRRAGSFLNILVILIRKLLWDFIFGATDTFIVH